MTLTQVKKIGYNLTGLEITTNEYANTAFGFNSIRALYININKKQLQNIYDSFSFSYDIRGISRQGIFLQALLHEVAHYKQYMKYGNYEYVKRYKNNPQYFEKVAHRYGIRYYKRFLDLNRNEAMV